MLEKWPWSNVEPKSGEHEAFSAAVSLKRIADTLENLEAIALAASPRTADLPHKRRAR